MLKNDEVHENAYSYRSNAGMMQKHWRRERTTGSCHILRSVDAALSKVELAWLPSDLWTVGRMMRYPGCHKSVSAFVETR